MGTSGVRLVVALVAFICVACSGSSGSTSNVGSSDTVGLSSSSTPVATSLAPAQELTIENFPRGEFLETVEVELAGYLALEQGCPVFESTGAANAVVIFGPTVELADDQTVVLNQGPVVFDSQELITVGSVIRNPNADDLRDAKVVECLNSTGLSETVRVL